MQQLHNLPLHAAADPVCKHSESAEVTLPVQVARISNEEQTLHQHFEKQWEDYCKGTWRLFPPLL